jgi:hypothetical protein
MTMYLAAMPDHLCGRRFEHPLAVDTESLVPPLFGIILAYD